MNADAQATPNSRQQNLYNCQTVIFGDNNFINLPGSQVQGNPTGNGDRQQKKVASFLPNKPFHVSHIRIKELNCIDSLFSNMTQNDDHKGIVTTVYVTGQPGAGKTELARQYAERFLRATSGNGTSTPLVITLNANSNESLLSSVKNVARELQFLADLEQTNKNLMDKLRDYLHNYNGNWLLIVDDMFENSGINYLFPRPGSKEWGDGLVLVTTQDGNLAPACHQFAKKYSVEKGMAKEDALALLTEISGVEADDFAEAIVEELQCLPLALACCATYVGETRQDRPLLEFKWEEYLNLYRETGHLESRTFSNNNFVYPFSMATAAAMAVDRMEKTSDVLRLTFSFLSYCGFFPVPLNVLVDYVKANLPDLSDELSTVKEIENEICRCTLLVHERSQSVETIKCHQVIRCAFQSVEETRPTKQREIEFVEMMKSVNETLDFVDNTSKEDVILKVLMRPHLKSFVDVANNLSWNTTAEFILISMKNGQFLFSTSNMPNDEAVKSLELLHEISLELDLSDERRCDILANLGFYYLELARDEDALNFLYKAYSMTEGKSENEWLLLRCRISFNLARAYYTVDSVDRGIEMMRRSIDLAKKVYIKKKDNVMNRYFWLVTFHFSWNKVWRVGDVVKEAKDFMTNSVPDCENLSRANCLDIMALIYVWYGLIELIFMPWKSCTEHLNCAKDLKKQSLVIYKQVLGDDLSSLPGLLTWFIILDELDEEPSKAKTQLEKAVEICTQNNEKFLRSYLIAYKKHFFADGLSWWGKFIWFISNLAKGTLHFVECILDDILEDYKSGRISPSRRIINTIEKARIWIVFYNFFMILLKIFSLLCLFFAIWKLLAL